jgi:hypothetical protein
MDWMTLAVEFLGIVILCVWVVIPIREFTAIARRILPKAKPRAVSGDQSNADQSLLETLP